MKFTKKILNILSSKFTGLVAAVIIITCTQFTGKLNAAIPEYKGLYTIFTPENSATLAVDTIGIGQALKYSNWLENVYTYAPEDNAARKVIAILWNKRLLEGPQDAQVFVETNNFVPSDSYPTKFITPQDLGKIIKYIREFKKDMSKEEIEKKRCEFLAAPKQSKTGLSKDLRGKGAQDKEILKNLIIAIEELKFSDNFIPEIAESILWAFFESKALWAEQEFKACLDEIDPEYFKKLQNSNFTNNFYAIDETTNISTIENIANMIIEKNSIYSTTDLSSTNNTNNTSNIDNASELGVHYDALTHYLIKSEKNKTIPTKVLQTSLKCKHPLTGLEPKFPFPTCFESSILDVLSVLFFNSESKQYDTSILPEAIRNSTAFKNLIDAVFKVLPEITEDNKNPEKEFLLPENINKNMQIWTNLISNLPAELTYKNNDQYGNYDLNPSFENFVKVLNKFLYLGFVIEDTKDKLKVAYNNENTTKSLIIEKDKLASWQTLFDLISMRLSTKEQDGNERIVKFTVEENSVYGVNFSKIDQTTNSSICTGAIKINVGYTKLHIVITSGHAKIICPERDKSKLAANNLKDLKNSLIQLLVNNADESKNLIPLFMFLPYIQIIENNEENNTKDENKTKIDAKNKIEELLYYSFSLKDHNIKKDFLEKIFENKIETIKNMYQNKDIRHLVSKLINLFPNNDENFTYPLISCLLGSNLVDNNEDKNLYWQNDIKTKTKTTIDDLDQKIKLAKKQNDENTLVNIFEKISIPIKIINKFLENILSQIIEQNPNMVNKDGNAPIHIALLNNKNQIKILQLILKCPNTNINLKQKKYPKCTPLHIATTSRNIKAMELLLSHPNIRVNKKNANRNPALTILSIKDNYDQKTAETLLSHKDIDIFDEKCLEQPLRCATETGNTKFIETILSKKPDLDKIKLLDFVLYYAYKINKTKDIIKIILEQKNLNINETDKDGNTLLHRTIKIYMKNKYIKQCEYMQEEFKQIISMLLENQDIDVNKREKSGLTPLHLVLSDYFTCRKIILIFLKHKNIDIYAKKKISMFSSGETPADIIKKIYFFEDDEKIIKELLEQKAKEEKIKKLDKKIDKIKNSWLFVNC